MTIYARERVSHVWLVDPSIETLEVFRLDGETWRMIKTWRGHVSVRAEPFDAIELSVPKAREMTPAAKGGGAARSQLNLAVLWDR